MKFGERYEIVEMVTSGRVSTFLARDRNSQEPVVVYTFECAGTGIGELSTASIIAKFLTLAPSPPWVIVKAGFDEPSSSAFITTKMPDTAALNEWVRRYHSFGKTAAAPPVPVKPSVGKVSDETAELDAAQLKALFAQTPAPKKQAVPSPFGTSTETFSLGTPEPPASQSAGEFTRLFREANAFEPVRSTAPPAPSSMGTATDPSFGQRLGSGPLSESWPAASPISQSEESSPGSFTREFLGLTVEKADVASEKGFGSSTPAAQNETSSFTKEFLGVSQTTEAPPARPSEPAPFTGPSSMFGSTFPSPKPVSTPGAFEGAAKSEPGEFTRAFKNPFEEPAPAPSIELPSVASAEPVKEQVGDFTRMFGREDRAPEPLTPVSLPEQQDTQPVGPSYTQIFGSDSPKQGSPLGSSTLATSPNVRPSAPQPMIVPSAPPAPAEAPRPVATPVPPAADLFSRPAAPTTPVSDQTFFNRPVSSTTDVFRAPGGDAPPIEEAPTGPSEFTVFLSRSQLRSVLPPEPVPNPAGAAGAPGFAPPAPPPMPAPPPNPFAMPAPPAAPKFAPPPMPAPPAFPQPAAAPPAAKASTVWPLITVLTILLAVGAILVMYFVMKH